MRCVARDAAGRVVSCASFGRAEARRAAGVVVRVLTLPGAFVSVFVCIGLVARIVGSMLWFVVSLPIARRVAVGRFERRLRRSGLKGEAASELVDAYSRGLNPFGSGPE